MRMSTIAWGLVLTITTAGVAWSQSLGDVARKEEERRKAVKTPAKVYTNEDLRRFPVPTPDAPADPAAQPAGEAAPAAAVAGKPEAPKEQEPSIDQGEEHWRRRMGDARSARARSDTYLEALESRLQTLQQAFYDEPDPARRAAVSAQRSRVFEDMETLRKEMVEQDAAIAKIEDEARKANIPPGWIR